MPVSNPSVEIFNSKAQEYFDKIKDLDIYNDTLDTFCASIKKQNAEIIELACGPGNITKYLLQQRPDFQVLGTDLSVNMLEIAKNAVPNAKFQLMDIMDIKKVVKNYDGIVAGFALPYLSKKEALKLIKKTSRRLNPNGVLYLSLMEDDNDKSGYRLSSTGEGPEMYMNYHEREYLLEALKENGFSIVEICNKIHPDQEGSTTKDLVIIAKKST